MVLDKMKKQLGGVAEKVSEQAVELGGRAADAAVVGLKAASEKVAEEQHNYQMKKYSPVFPDEYKSPDYDLPKMIVIVDEDERKGVEVCEGAIGWFSKEGGMEVLHLYEEAVPMSGLKFHPAPLRDTVYFADQFDEGLFINLSCYFDVVQQNKITELRRIAHALGAKSCRLEAYESEKTVTLKKGAFAGKRGSAKANGSGQIDESRLATKTVLFDQVFEGGADPVRPRLQWYAHDKEIDFLIDSRCGEGNQTKMYKVKLDSSLSATMSVSLAAKIDGALGKLGASCNFSLEGEAQHEMRQKLYFEVQF